MDDLFKDIDVATSQPTLSENSSIYIQQLMTSVEIGKALTSTFNMDQILIIILKRLSELIKAKNWTLFLLDPESKELYFEVVVGSGSRLAGMSLKSSDFRRQYQAAVLAIRASCSRSRDT